MAEEEDKEGEVIEAEPVKSSNKTVLIMTLLSMAVIVLTPLAVFYVFNAQSPAPGKPEREAEPTDIIEVLLPKVDGNIAGTKGTRVVQIECVLRLSNIALQDHFAEKPVGGKFNLLQRAKGIVSEIATSKTLDALDSPGAKKRLQKELKIALNEMLIKDLGNGKPGEIIDVYFSYFLMQ